MKRELCGIYFRVKRNGHYENVCFTDMTEQEITDVIKDQSADWWKSVAMRLKDVINEIAEAFDIVNCK